MPRPRKSNLSVLLEQQLEECEVRRTRSRIRTTATRELETSQRRHVRLTSNRIRTTAARQQETLEERQERLARKQAYSATAKHRASRQVDMWHKAAFSYNPATDYGADCRVSIGSMTVQVSALWSEEVAWRDPRDVLFWSFYQLSLNHLNL